MSSTSAPLNQASDDGVVGRNADPRRRQDEELAAVPVLAGAGHGQAATQVGPGHLIVVHVVARASGAVSQGAASLDEGVRHHPVKGPVPVETLAGQEDEAVDVPGRVPGQQVEDHPARGHIEV